jgi:glutaredoxin
MKSLYYLKSSSLQVKKTKKESVQSKVSMVVTKPGCPWCVKVKELLKSHGYVVQETDRSGIPDSDWPYQTVPQVWINGVHVEGGYEGTRRVLEPELDESEKYTECAACSG